MPKIEQANDMIDLATKLIRILVAERVGRELICQGRHVAVWGGVGCGRERRAPPC